MSWETFREAAALSIAKANGVFLEREPLITGKIDLDNSATAMVTEGIQNKLRILLLDGCGGTLFVD